MLHDFIKSVRNVGLEVFLFFHKGEFHEDFFDNMGEFELIRLLMVVGLEYFLGEDLD